MARPGPAHAGPEAPNRAVAPAPARPPGPSRGARFDWFHTRGAALLAALSLAACTPAEPRATDTAVGPPDLAARAATPAWTPAEVATAWDAAVVLGWPDAGRAHDVYVELLSHGDAACPGDALQLDDDVVLGCTAASGYGYAGISEYRAQETSEGGVTSGFHGVHGDFRLTTPEGLVYWVGGTAYQQWSLGPVSTFVDFFEGSWIWDGDDGPLRDGVSGLATTTITREGGVDTVVVDGALGFGGIALEADLVVTGEGCAEGTVAVRDPAVGWHVATFSGCDGCARVEHDGAESAEACFDLAPLAALPADRLGSAP